MQDTGGALFVQKKAAPPRHLYHEVDGLLYSLEATYIVEIGAERFHLKPGDCVLGPREIPHAWVFAGGSSGTLPAGKMETFFNEQENRDIIPGNYTHELLGPLLVVE